MKSPKKIAKKKRPRKGTNSTPKKRLATNIPKATEINRDANETKINDQIQIESPENIKTLIVNEPYKTDPAGKDETSKADLKRNGEPVKIDSFRNEDADTDLNANDETQPF